MPKLDQWQSFAVRFFRTFFLNASGELFTGKDDGRQTNFVYMRRYLVAKSLFP